MESFAVELFSFFLPLNITQCCQPHNSTGIAPETDETPGYKTLVKVYQERVQPRPHYAE